jgi:5'-nucleotidase
VRKLLAFNAGAVQRVEVVILSRNDPVTGCASSARAQNEGLALERGVFTQGARAVSLPAAAGRASVPLGQRARRERGAGNWVFRRARVLTESAPPASTTPMSCALPLTATPCCSRTKPSACTKEGGLEAFQTHETSKAALPLSDGPFKPLLAALHQLQQQGDASGMRLRTALVTARSAPAHERAINTLMKWNRGGRGDVSRRPGPRASSCASSSPTSSLTTKPAMSARPRATCRLAMCAACRGQRRGTLKARLCA